MKIIKLIFIVLMAGGIIPSCIERYYPGTETDFTPKLVIEGAVTTEDGEQEIVISESAPQNDPTFRGISGCRVYVEDDHGNQFLFPESKNPGYYRRAIDGQYIIIGSRYRLSVQTPSGKKYQSNFEELLPCPKVDSVYTELESKPTAVENVNDDGLQFFIDFKADNTYGTFFRWKLIETYEYHSALPIEKWLDATGYHTSSGPDFSHYTCYKTEDLADIFVLSTKGFTQNSYLKYKLHFVNDHTQRLQHNYSLLVKQYSSSAGAYNYWQNLKKNNQDAVNMFGKQPAKVVGNMYNQADSSDVALGYFTVSDVRTKRILVPSVKELSFSKVPKCKAVPISGPLPSDRPLFFADAYNDMGIRVSGIISAECILCELLGGTTVKPPYWDK